MLDDRIKVLLRKAFARHISPGENIDAHAEEYLLALLISVNDHRDSPTVQVVMNLAASMVSIRERRIAISLES